jgi:pSer/pThr/pTyr-binding forkhead associated (FHA) protein
MPGLVFYRRGEEVLRVTLEHRRLVLGRGEHCDVVIPDPHVSRQQVALHFDGTRCLFEDLSGHGTRVLGEPMDKGELPDGAGLELGPWRALFRLRGEGRDEGPTLHRSLTERKSRAQAELALSDAHAPSSLHRLSLLGHADTLQRRTSGALTRSTSLD